MYYAHFGLNQPPFRITPNTEFFFAGGNRGAILDALIYAVTHGEGIVKVTGEVGSGKTMLCNMLQSRLPAQVETVYIANPSVSPEEILHAVAFELQLMVPRDAGRLEVMQALHNYLLERYAQHKQVVVFIEESQTAPLATLEEIRLLSNLETQQHKLLQIVLFGQPELDDNLRQAQIRQLRERITHSFSLHPLTAEDTGQYLMFRLRAAGYRGPDLFSPAVIKYVTRAAAGLTRRINLIADKALLAAFSENTHSVKLRHVKAAVRDSEFAHEGARRAGNRLGLSASLVAIGAGLGAVLFAGYQAQFADRGRSAPAADRSSTATQPAVAAVPAPAPAAAKVEAVPAAAQPAAGATPLPKPIASPPAAASIAPAPAGPAAPTATPPAPAAAPHPGDAEPAVAREHESPAGGGMRLSTTLLREPAAAPKLNSAAARAAALERRLKATTAWLEQSSANTYSIQLLGAENVDQLKQHLNIIAKFVEINDIFVYRTVAKQKPSLTVLYGSFENRRDALDAMSKLPVQLKAYRPYLRTVQGIRAEIKQHEAS
ncbi:MAG TPA: AAA family ATPase [Burkholderiales bacterium]|nr:AAA family ATPase [Burkholderiales bacterium]